MGQGGMGQGGMGQGGMGQGGMGQGGMGQGGMGQGGMGQGGMGQGGMGQGGGSSVCTPGQTQACYTGPMGTENVGICKAGTQTCNAQGTGYGACMGEVLPAAMESCATMTDDNCNGMANEGCACTPGQTQPCYSGPMGTENVGLCKAGIQTCNAQGTGYGACMGEVLPAPAEVCSTAGDDNCNGMVNEGCTTTCTPNSNIIVDGGFEQGPGGGWVEDSLNFGTPLCDTSSCGTGGGTGPHAGSWWAWFGGITDQEEASVSQTVTIPTGGTATLSFYLEMSACDDPIDYLEVTVDGTQVFTVNGGDAACGTVGYALKTIDLSAYANNMPHTVVFHSESFGNSGGVTNFFVDDVNLEIGCPGLCTPGQTAPCYTGPAGTENVGLCQAGTKTCNAQGTGYGACTGQVLPAPMELCTTAEDDNCNGMANEGCNGTCSPNPNLIVDGGFEQGAGGGAWTEDSLNFGTPLCDASTCGTGGGTGPHAGSWWAWFGGISDQEEGSVGQTVTIPTGAMATLSFYLEMSSCDDPIDYLEVTVDGTQVFNVNGGDAACGTVGYALKTIDLSAYANNASHTIVFHSEVFGNSGGTTNFFVDDITLATTCP